MELNSDDNQEWPLSRSSIIHSINLLEVVCLDKKSAAVFLLYLLLHSILSETLLMDIPGKYQIISIALLHVNIAHLVSNLISIATNIVSLQLVHFAQSLYFPLMSNRLFLILTGSVFSQTQQGKPSNPICSCYCCPGSTNPYGVDPGCPVSSPPWTGDIQIGNAAG